MPKIKCCPHCSEVLICQHCGQRYTPELRRIPGNRTKTIAGNFTDEEKQLFKEKAKRLGISESEYLRRIVVGVTEDEQD